MVGERISVSPRNLFCPEGRGRGRISRRWDQCAKSCRNVSGPEQTKVGQSGGSAEKSPKLFADYGAMPTLRGQRSYAIKRFDRTADGPVHTEDFAQVFGVYPDDKYRKGTARHIAKVLGIETGEADIAEFFRRLVFNVLIGNADMHLKNWSLIYPDGRTPMIAPAYDFVSTIAYLEDDEAAIKFSQTKRFDRFTEDEISRLANKAGLPERPALQVAWETIERFRAVWADEKSHLPLPKDLRTTIEAHLAKLPIIRGQA